MKRIILIVIPLLLTSCGENSSQSKAMLAENLNCPEGSQSQIERWGGMGENGWLHVCKMKHGLFTAWSGDIKAVEGYFVNGKEEGVWNFWNKDGKKYKEITYKKGKEISVVNVK